MDECTLMHRQHSNCHMDGSYHSGEALAVCAVLTADTGWLQCATSEHRRFN